MKAVAGVDGSCPSREAVDLFLRLQFKPCEASFVHVVESALPDGSFGEFREGHPLRNMLREDLAAGDLLVQGALASATAGGMKAQAEVLLGEPAERLMTVADREHADLIVVGGNRRSLVDDVLLGSTARALLHEAAQHLLIGRTPAPSTGKLTALLAIDQRENPDGVVDEILSLCPMGIERLGILTVNALALEDVERVRGLPVPPAEAMEWLEEGLREKNLELAQKLSPLTMQCEPLVIDGETPARAIAAAADCIQADLILIGAERHGFWERRLRGSVSEELLAHDKRSLLVLRSKGKV